MEIEKKSQIVIQEINRIAEISGPVNCSIRNVCYLANKSFVFDDFAIGQRINTGLNTKDEINQIIQKRNIIFIKIDENARWHLP